MTANTECWSGRWWHEINPQNLLNCKIHKGVSVLALYKYNMELTCVLYILVFQPHSPHPVTALKLLYLPITLCNVYLMDSLQLIVQSAMVLTQPTVSYPTLTVLWLVVLLPSHQHWLETLPTTLCPQPLGLGPQSFVDLSTPALPKTLWHQIQ